MADSDEFNSPGTSQNEGKNGNDEQKFDRAKSLNIDRIRMDINNIFDDPSQKKNTKLLQIAVIIYLLDLTGCRPGSLENDRKEDDPSGRGIANLRVGHITLLDDDHMHLHFIAKSHSEYNKKHKVDTRVYKLLKKFLGDGGTMLRHVTMPSTQLCQKINAKRLVFNHVKYSDLEMHLDQKYGIKPRDFRTFSASTVFETELNDRTNEWTRSNPDDGDDEQTKIMKLTQIYGEARKKVKELLNHKDIKYGDNYIDPRIIVAWCSKNGFPLEKLNGFKKGTKVRDAKDWTIRKECECFVWRKIAPK